MLQYGEEEIRFEHDASSFCVGSKIFHKIENQELITTIVLVTSIVLNEYRALQTLESSEMVNFAGFGKSKVYKNFNYSECIVLD